jgi:hypothetical protein
MEKIPPDRAGECAANPGRVFSPRRSATGQRLAGDFEAEIDLKTCACARSDRSAGLPSVLLFASVEIDLAAWSSVRGRHQVNRLGRPSR